METDFRFIIVRQNSKAYKHLKTFVMKLNQNNEFDIKIFFSLARKRKYQRKRCAVITNLEGCLNIILTIPSIFTYSHMISNEAFRNAPSN